MKSLKDLQKKEVDESFIDPPVVLVLRRKAIRMFPRGQRVATYRNDNLKLDVAIPYNPDTLGTTSNEVAGKFSESAQDHMFGEENLSEVMSPELKKIRKDRTMFQRDIARQENCLNSAKQRLLWAKRALSGHIKKHGKTLDPIGEETINELSTKTLGSYIKKASAHAVDKASRAGYEFGKVHDKPNDPHHYDAGEKEDMKAASRLKNIARATNKLTKEETVNELSTATLGSYVKKASKDAADNIEKANHYTPKPIKYHRDKAKQRLAGIERAANKLTSEELMEATIYSLHAITKTQQPAQVRFKDGSSAMIDHTTASRIMKLHSKVNRQNKKKVESLINSGAMGIKKVSEFIRDHMKD